MNIILIQQLMLKDKPNTFRQIKKSVESNIIPHKGDYIQDSVWKDPCEQEVLSVTIDYSINECYVFVKTLEFESQDENTITKYIEMSKLHHWNS